MNPYDEIAIDGTKEKPAAAPNPYDQIEVVDTAPVKVSLAVALDKNPGDTARAVRLSRQLGAPFEAVQDNLADVEKSHKLDSYERMLANAPKTAEFLTLPDRAGMAHDDVENLTGIESAFRVFKNSGRAVAAFAPQMSAGLWGAAAAPFDLLGADTIGGFLRGMQKDTEATAKAIGPQGTPSGNIEAGWYAGLTSAGQNLAALPLALMPGGQPAALTMMVAPVFGASYGKARDKGLTPLQGINYGAQDAVAEWAGERLGLGSLVKNVKGSSGFGKTILDYLVREVPSEMATTLAQSFNEYTNINPDKPVGEWLQQLPDELAQTVVATLVGGGAITTAVTVADRTMKAIAGKQQDAEQTGQMGDLLAGLNKMAEASKLRERDTETAQGFFQSMLEEGRDSIYITPEALAQSGLAEQMAQLIPAVQEQIQTAAESGHDIRIPIADLMATMAGPELEQSILPHVAVEPGGFTPTTAQEYLQSDHAQELQAEVERVLGEKQGDDTFKRSAEVVKTTVKDQLTAAGRFTESVNDAYSSMVGSFYAVQAARMGTTPEAMFAKYPLKIGAESVAGQKFDQSPTSAGYGSTERVVDVSGNGNRVQYFNDKKGTFVESQKYPTGKVKWRAGEVVDGFNQWFSSDEFDSKDAAEKSIRGYKAKERIAQKYGSIPSLWRGEEKKFAKALIDAGFSIDRFSSSTQSKSKYIYLENGLKIRLADHSLPLHYDSPDFDFRYGDNIKALIDEIKNISEGAPAPNDANILNQSALAETEGFKKWSHGNAVIDLGESHEYADGEGVVVEALHGTTGDYNTFDRSFANIESDLGGGFYFTNTVDDAGENYAGLGPDLTNKVEQEAERIAGEEDIEMDDAREIAKQRYMANLGATLPVFVRFDNPVVLGGSQETFLDIEEAYDEETDEYGEPTGRLVSFVESLREVGQDDRYGDADIEQAISDLWERASDNAGLTASELIEILSSSEGLQYATDYESDRGELASKEIIRKAFEESGFDGFIDQTVNQKFGSEKLVGKPMAGMDENTVHFIAFNPNQIKSRLGNSGDFSETDDNILHQQARGSFNPATLQLTLLKNADLSTFLHESGHFFIEVQADLAGQLQQEAAIHGADTLKPGEQQVLADMQATFDWFGVRDLAEWNALDFEEKRSYHERFARGFEKYLFEGQAPAIEMQGVFQRFRAWMLNVYRDLKALNVELTDEVRGVFDRMLATSEQIVLAEQGRSMMPLFASPEQIGMTPAEFADYQALGVDATNEAIQELQARGLRDLQWINNARGRIIKQLQKEAAAQRAEVQMEVRAEVMSQPIYRAWQFLTGKNYANNQDPNAPIANPGGMTAGRVSLAGLSEIGLPLEVVNTLKARKMTAKEGLHPDQVAELILDENGNQAFSSGDELARRLASAETPKDEINALTDQRMLERFGDLSSEEAIKKAADKAIHNEARARMIATELNALEKATGGRKTLASAAREYAAAMIARLKVRDIKPGQYASAEVRAGKAAEKASKSGDIATAAAEQRNRLINNYATRAAYDAQDETIKALRYLKKFDSTGSRKGLDVDYVDQIDALLERFDLRKGQSLKAIDKRASFAKWLEAQREAGMEPDVPEELINEAFRKSYKDLTVEEMRGLVDTVKQIEHLGRLKRRLLTAKDQREFAVIVDEAEASIRENGGEVRDIELESPTGIKPWLEGIAAGHRKFASLLRQMDGGKDSGPLWRILGRNMNEAATSEAVMLEQATGQLAEIYKPILAMKGGTSGDLRFISEINASLTRGGRLAVALNWGNETNRSRIMQGDKWTPSQANAVLSTLTREEWQFVQNIWSHIDSYWPLIADKERRVTGRVPEKVKADPFVVTMADGSTMTLSGGYYPIKYDSNRDDRAEKHDAAAVADDMKRGAFARATTRRGHTKERVENVKRPVRKTLDVITQHISEVAHDLSWHEWLIDANRLIDAKPINNAIREHYGTEVVRTMKDMLTAIATADIVPQTKIDQAMLFLRANVSRSTMGLSLTTAFLQPFGLTQSMVRIGTKHVLRGMARWGGDLVRFENGVNWIQEKSEFMRLRSKTFNRELHEIKGRVSHGHSQARQIYDASLFMLMQKMQMIADVPTWIGAYEKATAENHDEATAIALADQAVLDSQGGGQTKDMAEFQRKHPMLTMFYSYFNVTLNLAAESTAKTDFKNPMAVAGWLSDMSLLMIIPALGPAILLELMRGGNDDDAEEWAKKLAKWQAGYLLGTVIGVREASGLVSGFDYAGPPVGRVISDLGNLGKQIAQGDLDESLALSSIRLMGTATGIPTVQIIRSWRGWNAWADGDAAPTAVLLGPPPKD